MFQYWVEMAGRVSQFRMSQNPAQFYVLVTLLAGGLFMDVENASAIQSNGEAILAAEGRIDDLSDKFGHLVALMDEQKRRDAEQDKEIEKLKAKDKEHDAKDKEHDRKIKEINSNKSKS